MHFKLLHPSRFLGSQDLNGKEVALTIRRVIVEDLPVSGGKTERKPIVYFVETKAKAERDNTEEKTLVLNRTNAKVIAKMYGPEVNDWTGKRVTFYSTMVNAFGEEVEALRIRPTPPAPATIPSPPQPEEKK